jgi:phage-related protein
LSKFELAYYELPSGKAPVEDFLDGLELTARVEAHQELHLLAEHGNELRMPHSRLLRDGLYGLRFSWARGAGRLFYFFVVGLRIILVGGLVKKTSKTPPDVIAKMLKRKKDWESRNK